ncbi:hypothetical protein AB2664_30070 [Bacillus wiedmannii]|uniref:hypothetical protein n=1 Tax=Bacillus wiedmannii TaxID=1890302 RepID=UPI003463BFA7
MATNEFLPFATAPGANVLGQADYVALAARLSGFQAGVAKSSEVNKAVRQGAFIASVIAQFVSDTLAQDVLDDGNVPALEGKLRSAVGMAALGTVASLPSSRGMRAQNNATTPNTQFDIAADMVALRDPSTGATKVFSTAASVTTNLLTAGPAVNGRDQAAAFPASSWIHFYLISNGSAVASIASLAAPPTGPAMPAGYTMWTYVGAVRFGSGSALSDVRVCGNTVFYRVPTVVLTGTATTNTPFSTANLVPPNALEWAPMVENLALSASGAGAYALTLFIDSYQVGLSGTGNASAAYSVSGGLAWLPNNGQTAQYRLNLMSGSGPTTTISVYGYRVSNGG